MAIVIMLTLLLGIVGFFWSLILSCKKSSAAGIIMSFVFWPIGLIIALTAKERPTIVNVYNHKPSDV
jgi:hypothetical protein